MEVNESSIKGYTHLASVARLSSGTVEKIVRSNVTGFKVRFLHVHIPDEEEDRYLNVYFFCETTGFDDMDNIYASPEDFENMKRRDKIRGLHLLEYFIGRCHQYGIPCEAWIKKGDPKVVICSEVKRVQLDLLVVGSRGLGPLHRVLVGTVSEFRGAKHADCPVITIKRRAEEAPKDPVE